MRINKCTPAIVQADFYEILVKQPFKEIYGF